MVSSGVVNGDKDSAISALGNYNSSLQALDGSWSGDSYSNLMTKAEEFLTEFKSTIEGGMSAFATACDLYVEYTETKRKISELSAIAGNNKEKQYDYEREIAALQEKLNRLKQEIEASLQSASSTSLSTSGANTEVGGLGGDSSNASVQGALTSEQQARMLEIARSQIGTPYESMNYGPDGEGFGCAMFVSYVYNNLLFGGVSGQNENTSGFYGSCKNFWGNVTTDGFDAHNKGFIEVPESEAQVGDIICFVDTNGAGTGHNDATSCYHVGLYEGDGKMIHSSGMQNGVGEINIDDYLNRRGRGREHYFIRYVGTENSSQQI